MAFARTASGLCMGACLLGLAVPRVLRVEGRPRAEPIGRATPAAATPAPLWTGVEIAADRRGHFSTEVRIDGFVVPVLVDTGATFLSLTAADARRVGLHLSDADFRYATATANGTVAVAMTTLHEVQLGSIRLHDVKATVSRGDGLSTSLLGMSFLSRLSRVEAADGRLILRP